MADFPQSFISVGSQTNHDVRLSVLFEHANRLDELVLESTNKSNRAGIITGMDQTSVLRHTDKDEKGARTGTKRLLGANKGQVKN